jgi:hypothetical protein
MPCPDLGALRASLDDAPGATPVALRDHLRTCPSCLDTVAELRRNAELAAPAIALTGPERPPPAASVQAAFTRLERRRARLLAAPSATGAAAAVAHRPSPAADPPVVPRRRRAGRLAGLSARTRGAAAALVAAAVLTGLVATPGGRAAASGFLAQFRSQRIQVVSLDRSQSTQLAEVVSQLVETGVFTGDVGELTRQTEPVAARDAAEAGRLAGFAVPAVGRAALPRGVGPAPERILVTRAHTARVVFDRDRAVAWFRRNGQPDARIPARYDGTQLLVQVPAVVVQEYAGRDGGPRLLVGKAGPIGLAARGGASLGELRDLLLRLPGLPTGVVEQLRNIGDWRTTLPLPVPTDQVRWRPATVGGAQGLSFTDQTGKLHALLWQRGGHIWGVAGVVGAEEAVRVADSLG